MCFVMIACQVRSEQTCWPISNRRREKTSHCSENWISSKSTVWCVTLRIRPLPLPVQSLPRFLSNGEPSLPQGPTWQGADVQKLLTHHHCTEHFHIRSCLANAGRGGSPVSEIKEIAQKRKIQCFVHLDTYFV